MFRVLLAQYRVPSRNEPVNSKAAVKYADAPVRFGMVELVALVLEHRRLAQYGEPVREAFRYEKLPVVVLRQLHGDMLAVGRRAFAYVNGDIEDFSSDAPHQLGLRERRTLEVQPPHHAVARHALVVLHELYMPDLLVELPLRETLEEITSRILVYLRLYYFHSS